ncbi:MAG: chemotaxis protein CheA [Chloroflexi bacterium]|nr:chemotaxis protein CheA [Chloroflexota bacterium]
MDLSPDISPEDLEVFLQEAEEQLELLDEDIVRLEREDDTEALLQEIFRAAHTLKGSAGMIGHHQMADMAHSMENILDQLRLGTAEVSTPIVDALLGGLDLLRTLKDDLTNAQDNQIDISQAVSVLDALSVIDEKQTALKLAGPAVLRLDSEQEERVHTALDAGSRAYLVKIKINPDTSWTSIRCFQIIEVLSQSADIIISIPSPEDIEAERVSNLVQAVLSTDQDIQVLQQTVAEIDDIDEIEVIEIDPEDPVSKLWENLLSGTPGESGDDDESGQDAVEQAELDKGEASADGGEGELAAVGAGVNDGGGAATEVKGGRRNPRSGVQQTQTVRVDVERLDSLMTTIGELVIDRTRIAQIGRLLQARYKEDELIQSLGDTAAHVSKVVDDLQAEIMEVRLMPIGTVFNGFPRMVRDLSRRFGKKVEFLVDGQDTEIDRTVIERIRDPLVHLIRNSIDHGIETPDKRVAAGKPEEGTIKLSATQEQGHIVIKVTDDGKGIDPELLRAAVVRKGLLTLEVAERLSDLEAIDLVFAPGASTAEETTEVSGRGVGMDIVKTNIESINGFVTVETKLGEGTTFTLRLPLTLATVQALLVSMNNTVFAVPAVYVLEVRHIEAADIETVEGNEVIRSRGNVVPLLRLEKVFARQDTGREYRKTATYVVVVKLGERLVGLAVESLIEMQEIMAKSLAKGLGDVKGIAGASILGDGRAVLIIDIPTLIQTTLMKGSAAPALA